MEGGEEDVKAGESPARAAKLLEVERELKAASHASAALAGLSDDKLLERARTLQAEGLERLQRGYARDALQKYKECLAVGQAMRDRRRAMAVEGTALGSLGTAYRSLGQHEKAIEHYTKVLAYSREIGDRKNEGSVLGNLGNTYDRLGQYEKAIEHHTQALAIFREIGDRQVEGTALGSLGNAYDSLGQYNKAIEHYTAALAISRETKDQPKEGSALGNLGLAYDRLGQYEKAIEHHTQALAIFREIGDRQNEGSVLRILGAAYRSLGQYEKAIEHYTKVLAYSRETGDRQGEGRCLGNLGTAYRSLRQYEKAIEHDTMALAISRETGDRRGEGSDLGGLGKAYASLGQYEKAIEHHTMAIEIFREVDDPQGEGSHLGSLGSACRSLGQCEKAMEHYTLALAISREIGDRKGEVNHLGNLGNACCIVGQYNKAIEHYTKALAISRETKDQPKEGSALGSLGLAYGILGQYEKAIEHYTMAIEISRKIGKRRVEGTALGNLGAAYSSLGQHEKAIENYKLAIEISRETGDRQGEGSCLGNLGTAYRSLGQYEKAIEHYTMALLISREIGDRQGEGTVLGSLGSAYGLLEQYNKALEHYTLALEISRETGDRRGEGGSLNNLGNTHASLGQYEEALECLTDATAVSDALWAGLRTDHDRISFGDTDGFTVTPRLLQLVHASLAQPEAALEVAERARSRAFELLLAQQRVQRGADAAAPPPTLPAAVDVAALRALAGRQRVALVVFSQVSETALLAWVVRGGGAPVDFRQLEVPAQGDASPLTQLVEQTRQTIGVRARQRGVARSSAVASTPGALSEPSVDQPAIEAALRGDGPSAAPDDAHRTALARCYELLIAPLGLSDGEPLLIVPARDLFALPFAALLDSDGKHLIERHSLRIAPSAGTLIELEQRAAAAARGAPTEKPLALIVGDPSFAGWTPACGERLPQLQGAKEEATAVGDCVGASHELATLLGRPATKAAAVEQMAESDVIHLATHGAPDGLFFAGKSEAEATLSIAEVQRLELRARLVVLSACDSFKAPKGESGSELSTDGVVGITRAFVAAGALTLVSSLWKVSDDATRELMRRFYEAWVADGDAAAALRTAMVGMIEDGRWTVQQWASFVVYGLAGDGVAAATSGAALLSLEGGGGGGSGGIISGGSSDGGGASGSIGEAAGSVGGGLGGASLGEPTRGYNYAGVYSKGLAGDSGGNVTRVFRLLFVESDGGQPMQLSTVAAGQPIKKGEYRCMGSYAFDGKDRKLPSRAYYYESWPHDSLHVDCALLHVHYAAKPDVGDSGEPTHVNLRKCWRVDRATIDAMRANTAVTDYPPPAGMAHPADRKEWQEWIDKFKAAAVGGAAAEAHYQAYLHNWSGDPKVNPTKQYFHPPWGFGSLPPGDGLWMEASGDVKGGSKGGGYPLTGGYGSSSFAMQPWTFSADPVPPFAWDTPKMVVLENKSQAVEVEARYDDARPTVKSSPAALPAVLMDAPLRVSATQAALKVERKRKGKRFEKALQSHSAAVAAGPQDGVVCFRCHDPGEGGHEGCFNPAADVEYRCCVRAKQVNDPNAAAKKKQPIVTAQQLARVLECGEIFRKGEVAAGRHDPTTGLNRSSGSSSASRDYSAMARASARLCDFADAAIEGEGDDSPTSEGEGDDL